MARIRVDDLDQTVDSEATPVRTRRFAVGQPGEMMAYSVDLTDKNYGKLLAALQPFIDLPGTQEVTEEEEEAAVDTQAVREWAKKNKKPVADRGRIPASLLADYRRSQRRTS